MPLTQREVVYAAQIQTASRRARVFATPTVTNRQYEGEITDRGSEVRVTGLSDPTVFSVGRNADIPPVETLSDSELTLVIDQEQGVNFQVDDLDALQHPRGRQLLLQSAVNAGEAIAAGQDEAIAAKMLTDAAAGNRIGTAAAPIKVNAPLPGQQFAAGQINTRRLLKLLAVKLDKARVPTNGRFAVLPSSLLAGVADDAALAALSNGEAVLNGRVGYAEGFTLLMSQAVPMLDGPDADAIAELHQVIAGHPQGMSVADQLVHAEFYRPERRMHAEAFKGSLVWGAKTFKPDHLAVALVLDESGLDV